MDMMFTDSQFKQINELVKVNQHFLYVTTRKPMAVGAPVMVTFHYEDHKEAYVVSASGKVRAV